MASVGRDVPSVWTRLGDVAPNLLVYLGVASVLGLGGSLLLSRRVKRQTLGMEPAEIVGLVEHREALVHGVKEGVIALDRDGRVTVANDSARDLLAAAARRRGPTTGGAAPRPSAGRGAQQPPDRLRPAGPGRRPRAGPEPAADAFTRHGDRLGHHAARPHRALGAGAGARHDARDQQHPARADPRVRQPAAHDLGPAAPRGVRRGRALRRRRTPGPNLAVRRGHLADRRRHRRRAADRQGQPGR